MPSINLTQILSAEYRDLFQSLEVRPDRFAEVDGTVDTIVGNKSAYENVSEQVHAPWFSISAIHNLESSLRFDRHLQRGEIPLFSAIPTAHVTPLRFSTQEIDRAEDLQRFLNTFPGISLRVDGQPGQKTSDAVKQILGFHLQGDPRSAAI